MTASTVREALSIRVAQLAAVEVGGPAVVFGSLPPEGRDLDLLVRRPERLRLERALPGHGLVRRGSDYALFHSGSAYEVELIDAESSLAPGPLDDLFAAAQPLPGLAPLAAPAPAHALLILARLTDRDGALAAKRRTRCERLLAAHPEALPAARSQAGRWQASDALIRLERELKRRRPARAAQIVMRLRRRVTQRAIRPGRRRTILVSLSGIDGSGKSSQARLLHEALSALGVEAALVWNDLQGNVALDVVAVPVKRVLGAVRRKVTPMSAAPGSTPPPDFGHGRARAAWAVYVTLANALEQRFTATRRSAGNRVVIFDRGPLDLAVRMEVLYRTRAELRRRLVGLAAPRPDLAFFLNIPPELSTARKQDIWSPAELAEHAGIYRELAPQFGVRSLDGERRPEDIAAEIGRAVWQRLG